jgi:hypothetical protein
MSALGHFGSQVARETNITSTAGSGGKAAIPLGDFGGLFLKVRFSPKQSFRSSEN